jgi:hypothetical protein
MAYEGERLVFNTKVSTESTPAARRQWHPHHTLAREFRVQSNILRNTWVDPGTSGASGGYSLLGPVDLLFLSCEKQAWLSMRRLLAQIWRR